MLRKKRERCTPLDDAQRPVYRCVTHPRLQALLVVLVAKTGCLPAPRKRRLGRRGVLVLIPAVLVRRPAILLGLGAVLLRLPEKLLRLAIKLVGNLLSCLGDLPQLLGVLADGLLICLGRRVDPSVLEPPVMLIRHLQVFAGQLIENVSGRLRRLRSTPYGSDSHPLALFEALTGREDVDALAPALSGLSGRSQGAGVGVAAVRRRGLKLPKLLGLKASLRADTAGSHGRSLAHAGLTDETRDLLTCLLDAAGVLLHCRPELGIVDMLTKKVQLGPCRKVVAS